MSPQINVDNKCNRSATLFCNTWNTIFNWTSMKKRNMYYTARKQLEISVEFMFICCVEYTTTCVWGRRSILRRNGTRGGSCIGEEEGGRGVYSLKPLLVECKATRIVFPPPPKRERQRLSLVTDTTGNSNAITGWLPERTGDRERRSEWLPSPVVRASYAVIGWEWCGCFAGVRSNDERETERYEKKGKRLECWSLWKSEDIHMDGYI